MPRIKEGHLSVYGGVETTVVRMRTWDLRWSQEPAFRILRALLEVKPYDKSTPVDGDRPASSPGQLSAPAQGG